MMNKIEYREMTLPDIEQVYNLECKCFSQPWSVESLIYEVTMNEAAYYVVALDGNRVAGYAGMWVSYDEAHMTNIAVAEEYRCHGIARGMILHLMKAATGMSAERMTLEVREFNYKAQRVYYAMGFRYAGERKRYYSDTGENAHILWNDNILETLKEFGVE